MNNAEQREAMSELRASDRSINDLPDEFARDLLDTVGWDVDLAVTAVRMRASWLENVIGFLPKDERKPVSP